MSWFSELTSKAEAMLVKLDQGTAEVLQNPDNILKGTKLLDSTLGALNLTTQDDRVASYSPEREESPVRVLANEVGPLVSTSDHGEIESSHEIVNSTGQTIDRPLHNAEATKSETIVGRDHEHDIKNSRTKEDIKNHDDSSPLLYNYYDAVSGRSLSPATSFPETPPQARKFKLQTSKLRQTSHITTNGSRSTIRVNGHNKKIKNQGVDSASLEADDIRASINKSLQEYSLSTPAYIRSQANADEQTVYTSYFDNQPNMIESLESSPNSDRLSGRLKSSPSFSISFPENSSPSTDITDQILRQSALNKKSAFNIHKVINKLAGNRGHAQSNICDKAKIRLMRAQMRATSYLRRLNYHCKAYSSMKYLMIIGCLIVLFMLCSSIYVLFIYQPSGSSTYLTSQVKQQRQDLVENLKPNSEKINSSPDDLRFNSFS